MASTPQLPRVAQQLVRRSCSQVLVFEELKNAISPVSIPGSESRETAVSCRTQSSLLDGPMSDLETWPASRSAAT